MKLRMLRAALSAALICLFAAPATLAGQAASADTVTPTQAIRPLAAVVVTAERQSAFEAAMARLGLRASISARQRENRRLAWQLAAYDRQAFTLERTLDSLMIVATIHEAHIARADSATSRVRLERARLESLLCEKAPSECTADRMLTSGKAD